MNKNIALLIGVVTVLVLMAGASYPVYAQATSTYTPTVTNSGTQYPTQTPYVFLPTQTQMVYTFPTNYACDSGGVQGWMTVTPDAFWNMACGQCAVTPLSTSTALPTVTQPTVTGTPPTATATVSPTPTMTVTASPVNLIDCATGANDDSTCLEDTSTYVKFSVYDAVSSPAHTYFQIFSTAGVGTVVNVRTSLNFHIVGTNNWPGERYRFLSPSGTDNMDTGDLWTATRIPDWTAFVVRDFQQTLQSSTRGVYHWESRALNSYPISTHVISGIVEVWIGSYPVATATPAPTGTPNGSYCASVNGGGGNSTSITGDSAVSWQGVKFGNSVCAGFDGAEVDLFGTTYGVPSIQICFADVAFGVITWFGVSVSLDAIAYILLAAWVVKRWITS